MKKFIEFKTYTYGEKKFVNIDHIITVSPCTKDSTTIEVSDYSFSVHGDYETIKNKIKEAMED